MTDYLIQNNGYKDYAGPSTFVFLLNSGDTFTLDASFTVSTADISKYLVTGFGNNSTVTIGGTLSAPAFTLSLGDRTTSGNVIDIAAGGSVASQTTAIGLWGSDSSIGNDGLITGKVEGISKEYGALGKAFTITNGETGTIASEGDAIVIGSTVKEKTVVHNNGIINGNNAFYGKSAAIGEIHNTGSITGDILFGKGADIFDGALGTISGTINGGTGRDTITTGKGADHIIGGANRDVMAGGAGADHFIFEAATDSFGTKAQVDLINGFSQKQHDLVDLELVDANSVKVQDQDFTFIGASATAGKIGQIWYQIVGETTYVWGNTDTDTAAEFGLALAGKIKLVVGDFDL